VASDQLLRSTEWTGEWWLPGAPSARIGGTLHYDPMRGVFLSLIGCFDEHAASSPRGPRLISGMLTDATPVTLYLTRWLSGGTTHRAKTQDCSDYWVVTAHTYDIDTAFVGLHCDSEDDLRFTDCSFTLSGMRQWLHKPSFTAQSSVENEGSVWDIHTHHETLCSAHIDGGDTSIQLINHVLSDDGLHYFDLRAQPHLTLSARTPRPFAYLRNRLQALRILFSILQNQAATITSLMLQPARAHSSPCAVYRRVAEPPNTESPSWFRVFLPWRRIHAHLPTLISNWFATQEQFEMLRYEYFATQLASTGASDEGSFLILTQMLEGFHRHTVNQPLLPTDEFERQCAVVAASLPHQQAPYLARIIKDRLRYFNEPSFRSRLKDLFSSLDPAIVARIAHDPAAFTQAVVDARNSLTHYTVPRTVLGPLEDPRGATLRLKALLVAHLLTHCGVASTAIAEGFQYDHEFQWATGGFHRTVVE